MFDDESLYYGADVIKLGRAGAVSVSWGERLLIMLILPSKL